MSDEWSIAEIVRTLTRHETRLTAIENAKVADLIESDRDHRKNKMTVIIACIPTTVVIAWNLVKLVAK